MSTLRRRPIAVAKVPLLNGHTGPVNVCATTSAPSSLFASAGDNVAIWDTRASTNLPVYCLKSHLFGGDEVASVAFSDPSGQHALILAHGQSVSRVDLRHGSGVIDSSSTPAAAAAAAAAVKETASSSPATPVELALDLTCPTARADDVSQVVVNHKGDLVAVADDEGDVTLLGLSDLRVFKSLSRAHENLCTAVAWRPTRPWELVSGGMDSLICHWDYNRSHCIDTIELPPSHADSGMAQPALVQSLAVSPNGRWLAASTHNGSVHLCAFGVYGEEGGGEGGVAQKNKSKDKKKKKKKKKKAQLEHRCVAEGAHAGCASHALCPDWGAGNSLVTAGIDGALAFWHVDETATSLSPSGALRHGGKINWLASRDDQLLVTDQTSTPILYTVR